MKKSDQNKLGLMVLMVAIMLALLLTAFSPAATASQQLPAAGDIAAVTGTPVLTVTLSTEITPTPRMPSPPGPATRVPCNPRSC